MTEAKEVLAADAYVEAELTRRLKEVEHCAEADVLLSIHPILLPFDDMVRDAVEDIKDKRESLLVILETGGGSIETAERMADVFRHHYGTGEVSFLVPNHAMSAGTILAMSGDRILMDYYSVLGPIDPQIVRNGQLVPALGYLEKYAELVEKSRRNELTGAELAFLIEKFDPAELRRFEQARQHSIDLLKRWLVQYKFKNWHETRDRKLPVTPEMKEARATEIAEKLNDTGRWRSHGRGLSMVVMHSELNLIIEDFGSDPALEGLNRAVRSYYRLLQDYMQSKGRNVALHTREKLTL